MFSVWSRLGLGDSPVSAVIPEAELPDEHSLRVVVEGAAGFAVFRQRSRRLRTESED